MEQFEFISGVNLVDVLRSIWSCLGERYLELAGAVTSLIGTATVAYRGSRWFLGKSGVTADSKGPLAATLRVLAKAALNKV